MITALLLTFLFIVSAAAVFPVKAASNGPVSYNAGPASKYHAPISSVGLVGLAHYPSSPRGTIKPFTSASGLSDITPAGSIRFINDSSYILDSETSVAVDPNNPSHVVGTYNDGRYFFCPAPLPSSTCPSGWTYSLSGFTTSSNGGHSVAKSNDIPSLLVNEYDPLTHTYNQSLMVSWGDPSVVAAPNGVFYYASLLIDPFTGANGVMMAVSNSSLWTSGNTCTTPNATPWENSCWRAAVVYANTTMGAGTFEDKELGAVDWSASSGYYGDLYLSWDHFFATGLSSTFAARCTPTLSCTMISGGGVAPLSGSDPFVAFSTPQVGADGSVYVTWCNYGTFTTYGPVTCRVVSSPAGGASFGSPADVVSFMGTGTNFPTDSVVNGYATEQFRTASIPVIATDGHNANNVYFTIAICTSGAYYAYNNLKASTDNPGNCGNSGIVFARSTDKGATWSTPQIISNPAVNIQPWVTVDSSSGEVVVSYLTSQFDPFNHRIDVLAQISTDGGTTWSTRRITPVSDEPNADPAMYDYTIPNGFGGSMVVPQFGDYFQAVVVHGNIYVLYTGNYVPEQGTYKASPFLAVTPSVAPHLQLAPAGQAARSPGDPVTQGAPGDSVPFNATGFTEGDTFTLTLNWSGITVSLANGTVSNGGVAAGNFVVPNVESQVYTLTASDSGGVSASASFGVTQLNLAPVQASISQLSTSISQLSNTLSTDFTSLGTSVSALSTTLGSDVSALQGSISGVQSSISGVNTSLTSGFASISGPVSTLSSRLTSTQGSLSSLASQLTTTEYLVVVAIIVAAIAVVFAALSMRKKP